MALPARAVWAKVEIEFVPQSGTYIDISARVSLVMISRPRSPDGQCAATTVTITLDNKPDLVTGIAPFNPKSPLSPYWPNVTRDRRVKVTAIWAAGASTSGRFLGWSDTWVPDMSDGSPNGATVTLSCSGVASRHARRKLLSDYGEKILGDTGNANDYWPFDEDTDAASVQGKQSDSTAILTGQVIPPHLGTGSMSLDAPDATILVDGSATFTRGDTGSASPVIQLPVRPGSPLFRVSAWVRLPQDPAGLTDDVMGGYDAAGNQLWRLVANITAGTVNWKITDGFGTVFTTFDTGYGRDDAWHWLSVLFSLNGSSQVVSGLAIRDKNYPDVAVAGGFTGWLTDPRFTTWLIVGGRKNPVQARSQTNTLSGSVSSVWVKYNSFGTSWSYLSAAGLEIDAVDRAALLIQYGAAADGLMGGGVGGSSPDTTPLMLTGQKGKSVLDMWNEHALTIGGLFSEQPDGRRRLTTSQQMRPVAVSLTLDAALDLDMGVGGWSQISDERPTRASASGPVGTVDVIDTVTEAATGLRLDAGTIATAGGSLGVLQSVAARAIVSVAPRLGFGVDLLTSANDVTTATMAFLQGFRIRVTNLATSNMGVTYTDVFAYGWTETYASDATKPIRAEFVFDTDPADDPSEAYFDDSERGRFALPATATISGGTCVGNTGTGTVIVTSTKPLTATGGQYPFDLDWNGERITISAVGGSTSPQTCTVSARGVAPAVARVHVTGETVNVFHAMTFG